MRYTREYIELVRSTVPLSYIVGRLAGWDWDKYRKAYCEDGVLGKWRHRVGVAQSHDRRERYVARCPFHQEKSGSFFASDRTGRFRCHGCGQGGDVFDFVMEFHRWKLRTPLSFTGAVAYVAKAGGLQGARARKPRRTKRKRGRT